MVKIFDVTEGSKAYEAGIKAGDDLVGVLLLADAKIIVVGFGIHNCTANGTGQNLFSRLQADGGNTYRPIALGMGRGTNTLGGNNFAASDTLLNHQAFLRTGWVLSSLPFAGNVFTPIAIDGPLASAGILAKVTI